MKNTLHLGIRAWPGFPGDVTFPLSTLTAESGADLLSVVKMIVTFMFTITTGAGGGCTFREILEWVSNINLRLPVGSAPITGINLYELMLELAAMENIGQTFTADIAASEDAAVARVQLVIPFAHPALPEPESAALPVPLLAQGSLAFRLGAAALNANSNIDNMTIELDLITHRGGKVRIPAPQRFGATTLPLQAPLPDGVYPGLMIVPPATGFLVNDINNVRLVSGGQVIHTAVPPTSVINAYLVDQHARSGSGGANPAGAFLGGSKWEEYADLLFLPLLWLHPNEQLNRYSQIPDSRQSPLLVDCDGNMTDVRYVWHRFKALTRSDMQAQTPLLGATVENLNYESTDRAGKPVTRLDRQSRFGLRALPMTITGVKRASEAPRLARLMIKR